MKAGRKRKTVRRQPNGQPYRKDTTRDTVVEARMRIHGLTATQAREERAGYAIGRMALAGAFGPDYQPALSAVHEYVEAVANYMRLKHPMHPMPKAMDYMAGKGASLRGEPELREVNRVIKRYESFCGLDGDMRSGKLSKADGIDRMNFHRVAFHDHEPNEAMKASVIRCVALLKG